MAITNDVFTGPGGNTGGSEDLAPVVQEVWTDILQEPRFEDGTLMNWATDLSEYMSEGGDIAHVPGIYTNEFTPKTQSTQGNEVDTEAVAATDTTLEVDVHKYVAFMIGDRDMVQMAQKYSLNEAYVREARELLMKDVEDALFGLYSDITSYTVNGGTPDQLSDADIRESIELLDSNEHVDPRDEAAFFLHPFVFWRQLGAVSKYYETDKSNFDFLRDGNFGQLEADNGLYGVPIYTSSRVQTSGSPTVYKNLLCTREAFGFALQTQFTANGTGRFRAQVKYRPENLATLAVVDVIYGVTTLRESDAVLLNSSNTAGQA